MNRSKLSRSLNCLTNAWLAGALLGSSGAAVAQATSDLTLRGVAHVDQPVAGGKQKFRPDAPAPNRSCSRTATRSPRARKCNAADNPV